MEVEYLTVQLTKNVIHSKGISAAICKSNTDKLVLGGMNLANENIFLNLSSYFISIS